MREISLNILDVAQNAIAAKATLVEISLLQRLGHLDVLVRDNGCGMTKEQVMRVSDPFYTTRKTRRVGLGIPFFKMASEMTGGALSIESEPGVGTTVRAGFNTGHIDCMPLGDMEDTICSLITLNENVDFVYTRAKDDRSFVLDTREFRRILGDIPLNRPEIALFIRDYLRENASF